MLRHRPAHFEPAPRTRKQHLGLLREAIASSCASLRIDIAQWVLALSGGTDSRAILAFLAQNGPTPRCVTWTTKESLHHPLSDAAIARLIAKRFGARHDYLLLDNDDDPRAETIERFIALGEGRTDQISGYVDGCRLWAELVASGVKGVIRGDESFGARKLAKSIAGARRVGCGTMVGDYPPAHLLNHIGLVEQQWPDGMRPRPSESLEAYRDRMYQEGYLPTLLASLNELKGRYVELVNPLISRRVITLVRTLPDKLRRYGTAFLAITAPMGRPVPYARSTSTLPLPAFLSRPDVVLALVRELTSPSIENVMTEEGAMLLLAGLGSSAAKDAGERSRAIGMMKATRTLLPKRLAMRLTPGYEGPDPLPAPQLALRAVIASRMISLLQEDAAASERVPAQLRAA